MAKKKVKAKSKPKAKARKPVEIKRSPRQPRLPGTGDAKLADIHNAALDYADVRDERMALSKREGELKADLLTLMHKHKKQSYSYQGVNVVVKHESETVKVRVTDAGEESDVVETVDEDPTVVVETEESENEEIPA